MPLKNDDALKFLLSRRSRPAKTLRGPYPTAKELEPIITAGLRTPDHGKLEPWRLIVLEKPALTRLAGLAANRGAKILDDAEKIEKGVAQYRDSGCAICVIESPVPSEKVPQIEQTYSTGAVCLSLLNAALASGWGANWLSGWTIYDDHFARDGLGLAAHERIAGMIHIGTETATPPERPRPNQSEKVTWISQ